MALNKPTFKVNVAANRKTTERKTLFADIKPDTAMRLRVAPPVTEAGTIFAKVTNHFQLKNEEGFGMALACLCEHGNDDTGHECYLCPLSKYLKGGDKADQKVSKALYASPRWYLQAFVYDKDSDSYVGPKLVGLSKTTAEAVNDILVAQEESGDDFFCDPENGQDLIITRRGAGLNTKYSVAPTGNKMRLDDVCENWEDKLIMDIYGAMDLKLEDPEGQKRAVYRTFEDELDWEKIQEAVG